MNILIRRKKQRYVLCEFINLEFFCLVYCLLLVSIWREFEVLAK